MDVHVQMWRPPVLVQTTFLSPSPQGTFCSEPEAWHTCWKWRHLEDNKAIFSFHNSGKAWPLFVVTQALNVIYSCVTVHILSLIVICLSMPKIQSILKVLIHLFTFWKVGQRTAVSKLQSLASFTWYIYILLTGVVGIIHSLLDTNFTTQEHK